MKTTGRDGIIICSDCGESANYEFADNTQDIIQQTGYVQDVENPELWRCPACQEYVENKHDLVEYEQDHQDDIVY
jgi:hypothetical protein